MALPRSCDVLVVGSGNAGLSAAVSAAQTGAKSIVIIDKCPEDWSGGNSYFTAGAFRTAHTGIGNLLPIVNNVDTAIAQKIDLDPYSHDHFLADLSRVTQGRADPKLGRILVEDSNRTVKWLAKVGVRFQLSFNRQAYQVGDRFKFWGGLCLKTEDGGKGLIKDLQEAAKSHGIRTFHSTPMKRLVVDQSNGAVRAAIVHHANKDIEVNVKSVVLAAGGFEANPRMRSQYLGPGWDLALVRGTPYNTGDCLEIAMRDVSAKQAGNWSGCHSVAWDANAPAHGGDRDVSNEFTKSGYPLGVMINVNGERFVDEGVDFRNYTYAKFGRAILAQPDGVAFQVWDAQTSPLLRPEEYRDEIVERITASTIEELAEKCAIRGLQNPSGFVATLKAYNEAVHVQRGSQKQKEFNPAIKDGLCTRPGALPVPKTNWALPVDQAPFLAVKVGCGVTFTFGGLAVDPETAGVVTEAGGQVVPGLYAIGEMLGGLYYSNYPGGSGLTAGAVWGRRAGREAARRALSLGNIAAKL
ncbi:tricarballylate dehydrogenase [Saccharata proteae CBS 121410]|uniref:Tricarballylate dehydrogenase n=1 Tax=Saccharata proteae CBS 121410 TaxID=1314787 RepID=A0A6A5YDF3_9PEZI|nr:tricarballylate dehydrogenase [Saccharata proteae CBS 121410]